MAECVAVREAMVIAIQKKLQMIIIESHSQLVLNSTSSKISVPKDIINLVADIIVLSSCLKDIGKENC